MSAGLEVTIAGGGVAAAASAIRMRSLGFGVRLIVRRGPPLAGIEAVPQRALGLLDVLGEPQLVASASGVEVEGPGHRMVHVERGALARAFVDRAVARGAAVHEVRRLPRVGELVPPALAVIDATGRAAAWSRPLLTDGHDVAWQFEGAPQADLALRVVRGDGWWAYRLGIPSMVWAGVVVAGPAGNAASAEGLRRLGLNPESMVPRGRRRARVQRAVHPVAGRRIAVGDAVLAYDPIAGGGIRFAMASAVAAATAIATRVNEPGSHDRAAAYYTEFVAGEHLRHLEARRAIYAGDGERTLADVEAVPGSVRFTGAIVETSLVVDGTVRSGDAVRLPDGTLTRWLGSFDLLVLARLAADPLPRIVLLARLQQEGLDVAAARAVLSWATRHRLLTG